MRTDGNIIVKHLNVNQLGVSVMVYDGFDLPF
jgi:hypothetical protein